MSPHTALGTHLPLRPYERAGRPTSPPTVEGVFDFVVGYKKTHDGNSPSFREIQEGCEISSLSVVLYYLNKLEGRGLIRRQEPKIGERYCRKIEIIGGKWVFHG
ncbi:hypothetical protein D4S03_08545 [bacterium]|nr:MAG: hypothetical protein D4S03_08545 [bacterium]